MIADCTGRPLVVPAGSEFGARWAALLAAVGIGRHASVAEVAGFCLPMICRSAPA